MMKTSEFTKPTIFNGTYTICHPTKGHRTVQIRTQDEDARFAPGERVISLLTGPDNTRDYKGFGFVKNDGAVIIWKKNRGQGKPSKFEIYADIIRVKVGKLESRFGLDYADLEVKEASTCMRCNRPLTNPWSIENGIGPVCLEKM